MMPAERLKNKIEKENLWLFVLSILSKEKRYGKELRGLIKERFGFVTGLMTAYKVLYLLSKDGYVLSKKQGKLVYYKVTDKGREELRKAKRLLKSYQDII